jgi:ATP-dependent helicase/nuclease subunit A
LPQFIVQPNDSPAHEVKVANPVLKFKDYQVNELLPLNTSPKREPPEFNLEQRRLLKLGTAFHAVLEYVFKEGLTEIKDLPTAKELAAQLNLSLPIASVVYDKVVQMLANESVQKLVFDSRIRYSWEELDLVTTDGKFMRIDRLLETDDVLVILDYKLSLSGIDESLFADYQEQMFGYRNALRQLRDDKPIKAYLLSAAGEVHELLD